MGPAEGVVDGTWLGVAVGESDGENDGLGLGFRLSVGSWDGTIVGLLVCVGLIVGDHEGLGLGAGEAVGPPLLSLSFRLRSSSPLLSCATTMLFPLSNLRELISFVSLTCNPLSAVAPRQGPRNTHTKAATK